MNIDRMTQDYIDSAFDGSLIKYLSHLVNINAPMSSLTDIETSLIWGFIESQQKTINRLAKAINDDVNHGVKLDLWSKAFIEAESILK